MIPVQLDHVTKVYGEDSPPITMDVTIAAGEFFTLLGPSGCGKSTMLRIIAGFVQPTSGRVLFGDRDQTRTAPHRRDTGMVFQNYALFPHLSVAQNVAYGLTARKVAKPERAARVARALADVGLDGYQDRRINELSGGQQQRVALARAVVVAPSVLLLDEPLSNLDAKLREETRAQIRRVQSDAGITGVYVTHDQAEAMAMSDRIAVLDAGRVHQVDTPREIYHHPATGFVARFIGGSNVLPVEVLGTEDDDRVTVALPGGAPLTVPGRADLALAAGDRTSVSLRPETLSFVEAEAEAEAETAAGVLRGTVARLEFNGATSSYEVAVGEHTVQVTTPDQAAGPRPGDEVSLACAAERAWLVTA
ncbi:ABC transporter ATP-binding protein [Streptomyces sp. DSM 44915]|uniref:ABC transporter ATP-binding protein n=1 Tax=Streptomyces chisholmiae TaxID=3075540 RepID=A0ABU2JXI6_9ACTN|nr:ABC transporter ATP-binding protein [Streptomyces sp. DSM 44915]MDT0269716.1 ABC transporter ATP-binding protein [Streptomyces sp. DSM 44915]